MRKFSACRSSFDENWIAPELGHPFDHVGDVGAEQLLDPLDRRLGVLDDVVQQPGGDGDDVELHVGEQVGDLERMDEVRLAGVPHLTLVLEGRKDVRAPQQFGVSLRIAGPYLFDEVLEPDHECRCLTPTGIKGDNRVRHPLCCAAKRGSPLSRRLTARFLVHYTDAVQAG